MCFNLVYIFSKGCPNEHISNIIDFTDVLEIPKWNVDCQYSSGISSCGNWYCWNDGLPEGSIQTELVGNGRGRLDFGNCCIAQKASLRTDWVEVQLHV